MPIAEHEGGPLVERKVLIVDDEAVVRSGLARLLEAQGARCATAPSAESADELLEQHDFDAAVIDYWLFGETGPSLIRRMRERRPPTAAIMITGIQNEALAFEGIAAGADDVLIKPVHWRDLLDKVLGAVGRTTSWRRSLAKIPPDHDRSVQPITHGPALQPIDAAERDSAALKEALATKGRHVARRHGLSPRECEVLEELLWGRRNPEIEASLGISERTVKFHMSNIFDKLLVNGENRSRSDLILYVLYHEDWEISPGDT